jgi:hypothetical protein
VTWLEVCLSLPLEVDALLPSYCLLLLDFLGVLYVFMIDHTTHLVEKQTSNLWADEM